jgi:hypothetical protein
MSLFDQMSGFTFPDVLMNKGPLPSTAGGPAGSDGSVDGVINGTSALLQNINPYAIGKSARAGSDRNYQQIPHRQQYIIPKLCLPDFSGEGHVRVSHAVDQGDLAFMLYAGKRAWWTTDDQFATRAPPCAFGSIEVVNYILACLQASQSVKWQNIRADLFEHYEPFEEALRNLSKSKNGKDLKGTPLPAFNEFRVFQAVRVLVQQYFVPHGICAGSEKQGGQHEHDAARPVQAPVNYVTTMTVDGKNVDLVNYWYGMSIVAGDQLIFRLERQKFSKRQYDVTRYYKQPAKQVVQMQHELDCWQLVPDVLRHENGPLAVVNHVNEWYNHLVTGYWRVAQTFHTRKQNNVAAFHRGMPLEVTFAPVWNSFESCRDSMYCGDTFLSSHVHVFDNKKHLEAEVEAETIVWEYGNVGGVFKIHMSQEDPTRYEIIWDPERCTTYLMSSMDTNKLTGTRHEATVSLSSQPTAIALSYHIDKKAIKQLCVVFADDTRTINQVFTPQRHAKSQDVKRTCQKKTDFEIECTELTEYTDLSGSGNTSTFAFTLQFSIIHVPYRYDVHFLYAYFKASTDFLDYNAQLWQSGQVPEPNPNQTDQNPLIMYHKLYQPGTKTYLGRDIRHGKVKVFYCNTQNIGSFEDGGSTYNTMTIGHDGKRNLSSDITAAPSLVPFIPSYGASLQDLTALNASAPEPFHVGASDEAESSVKPAKQKRVKTLKFFDGTSDVSTNDSGRAAI